MTSALTESGGGSRLSQLRRLGLLDSAHDEHFHRITRLAMRMFDVPIAFVQLIDEDRQLYKAVEGIDLTQYGQEFHFFLPPSEDTAILEIPDAANDARFADEPLVTGTPGVRFFAAAPIEDPTGVPLGRLCILDREPRTLTPTDAGMLRDLAELVEEEIVSYQLATADVLTGLSNRRGFELLGAKVIELCRRAPMQATLLYLDVDNLKPINDELGHGEGDTALREFARLLDNTFRASDVIARIGGDEFAVLLSGAATMTDPVVRLEAALAERSSSAHGPYELAVSVGSATFDPADGEDTLEAMTQRADRAMYEAKAARHAAG